MTLDFPQPLGPTTPTSWPGTAIVVGSTKDLKPASFTEVSLKGDRLIFRFSRMAILPEHPPESHGPTFQGA